MLLSFNYTATAKMYGNFNVEHNYIHGELERPENIILGYGDELDKDYQDILDRNDNELFKNVKSVKYLETRHYQNMLEFLMAAPFQVLIIREFDISSMQLFCFYQLSLCSFLASLATDCMQ